MQGFSETKVISTLLQEFIQLITEKSNKQANNYSL